MNNFLLVLIFTLTSVHFATAQYCSASSSISSFEWIERVSFGFDKQETGNNGGYYDGVLDAPMHASIGECFYVTAEPGYSGFEYTEYWGIWMDFNQDGDYNDTGENVFLSSTPTNYGMSSSITIPDWAPAGWTQMRVIMKWGSAPTPCGSFSYGEVEDYSLYIEDGLYSCENDGANSTWEWIDGVGVGDLYLFNGINDGFHADYCQLYTTDLSDDLFISWTPGYFGTVYEEFVKVSFDANNDNFFSAAETQSFSGLDGPGNVTFPLDPSIEPNVCHRFRIQLSYYDSELCHYFTYGEVEEYAVYITDLYNIHALADPSAETRRKHNDGDPRQMKLSTVELYPNPARDNATLEFTGANTEESANISLLDITGKVLLRDTKKEFELTKQLDLSSIQNGTYIIQIRYANHIETKSIIITRK